MSLLPKRLPILYLILGVLLLVSVVPMYFYADRVVTINRERLKVNEQMLQNTVTRSLSDDLTHRQATLQMMLENLASAVSVTSGGDLTGEHVSSPEMRALLEKFVTTYGDLAYATLLNADAKGISAGKIQPDAFLQRELEQAFLAARDGRPYSGNAVSMGVGKAAKTLMVVSQPLHAGGRFVGMIGSIVDLQFLVNRLRDTSQGGLMTYVIDRQGRLVAEGDGQFAVGQDMTRFEIVKKFVEQKGAARLVETTEFEFKEDRKRTDMLGTYSPVPSLQWAVIAQKDQLLAYSGVFEMQRYSRLLALLAVLLSVGISSFAARQIATPLEKLTESSRAIAMGDFSQRVQVKSRTEIGELASTFNHMTEDLERFVHDLKRAAEENRALFINSIQMLAGAVDEKDPYTRGHSDRVTKYSTDDRHRNGTGRTGDRQDPYCRPIARCWQNRHRRSHPEKARSTHTGRIRDHEDAHDQGRKHPASGRAVARHAPRHRTSPRVARRPWLPVWTEGRRDPANAENHHRRRHLRRDDDEPSVPGGDGSRIRHSDHQFPGEYEVRPDRGQRTHPRIPEWQAQAAPRRGDRSGSRSPGCYRLPGRAPGNGQFRRLRLGVKPNLHSRWHG